MTQTIDKMSAILVALELINDLSKSSTTIEDIQATQDYIHSIVDVIPFNIVMELHKMVSYFEISKTYLEDSYFINSRTPMKERSSDLSNLMTI